MKIEVSVFFCYTTTGTRPFTDLLNVTDRRGPKAVIFERGGALLPETAPSSGRRRTKVSPNERTDERASERTKGTPRGGGAVHTCDEIIFFTRSEVLMIPG